MSNKAKKNNKGFTLIELLAVVMVLGIIALISVPSISKLLDKSKKDALLVTANNLVDTAKQYYMNEVLENDELVNSISLNVTDSESMKLFDYSGKLPSGGYILVDTTGNIGIAVSQGDYCATKEIWDDEVVISSATNCEITSLDQMEEINNSCFILNDNKDTIIGYKSTASCPKDVVIPAEIGGREIVSIGAGAFAGDGQLVARFMKNGQLYDDIIENSSFYGSEPREILLVNATEVGEKRCYFSTGESAYDYKPLDYVLTSSSGYVGCEASVDPNSQVESYGITSVNFNMAVNLKSIGYAAFINNKIESLIFTNDNISIEEIASNAFTWNIIDGTLDLSSLINLKNIGANAFDGNALTSVIFPEGLETIGFNAFKDNSLTSITMSTTIKTIGYGAFLYNNIESLDLSNSTKLTTIEDSAFEGNLLTTVKLPSSITTIGEYTFGDNDSLTTISINKEYETVDGANWGADGANVIWLLAQKYAISYSGSEATISESCQYEGKYFEYCNVKLSATESGKIVVSFNLNGTVVYGNSFEMPGNDVAITDVVISDYFVLESNHPYSNNMD